MNPLRENGRFGIETYCLVKEENHKWSRVNWRVVYADTCEASYCSWMVPGTMEWLP